MSTQNRKARFDYTITDTFEVGIVLVGAEVKSARAGQVSLDESYAKITGGKLQLINARISPYKFAPIDSFSPTRTRDLLIHKQELLKLATKLQTENLTLVPLKLYFKGSFAKVELGLARGKKKYDKRETLKKRTVEREAKRKLS